METVLIVVHLMIVLALVGVVLVQRSEGGGLGIGGGSGFMTARGAANALTRTTAILAAAFFVSSLGLAILARDGAKPTDLLDRVPAATQQQNAPAQQGVLDQLPGQVVPQAPAAAPAASDVPAPVAPSASEPAAAVPAPAEGASQPAEPQVPNN